MKFIKKLKVSFYFDFREIKNIIVDELSLHDDLKASLKQKEIFLKNFNFFAKKENEKNKLNVKTNNYFDWMVNVLSMIKDFPDKEKKLEEFEDSIKDDIRLSYLYANRKNGRFIKGEPIILQDLDNSISYFQMYFNKDQKWEAAEELFSKDPYASLQYAKRTRELFPKGEDVISKNATTSVEYANFFKIRFKKGEEQILKSPEDLITYLKLLKTIEEEWEEGKEKVFSNSLSSYLYCKKVLEKRDSRAEKAILQDEKRYDLISLYARDVIKGRWIDGEKKLLEHFIRFFKKERLIDYDILYDYIKHLDEKERILIFEPYLVKGPSSLSSEYVFKVIKGRWPELEKRMKNFSISEVFDYVRFTNHAWEEAEKKILSKNNEGNFENSSVAESYLRIIVNNENITPYIKNFINEIFSKIKNKDDFFDNFSYKIVPLNKLDYFKKEFNKNLPRIIKMIDVNEFFYSIEKDRPINRDIKIEKLRMRVDLIFYALYSNDFYKITDDNNKKLLNDVADKTFTNVLKIIKEKKLYKYPLIYFGEGLISIKNNDIVREIIDLFNEERSKEYAFLNSSENIKRINAIKDEKENRKQIEDNAALVKETLSNILKYN